MNILYEYEITSTKSKNGHTNKKIFSIQRKAHQFFYGDQIILQMYNLMTTIFHGVPILNILK